MIKRIFLTIVIAAAVQAIVDRSVEAKTTDQIPRITKEELRGQLGNPEVVIIDVRIGSSWKESEYKIKGAVREDPADVSSWITEYPKDKTLIFYCS
jgi:rhodanese-related sulfurtransferase